MRTAAAEAFQRALLDDDPVALYERAPCGYLSTAPDGRIVKTNQTFLTWTGYTADDLVGRRHLVDLLTAGGRLYHETHLSPMLHALGEAKEIALDVVRADGRRMPVLVNAVLDRDAAGEPQVVRIALFDASDRRRYEEELLAAKRRAEQSEVRAVRLAQTLQQTLIPPVSPQITGLDLAAAYRPAGAGDEVGGDFYDVFELGRGEWVLVLGDASGKGAEAAVVTALVRHTVRALAVTERSPGRLLDQLNAILMSSAHDRFCTLLVIRLRQDRQGWTASTSSGGHPLPFLLRPGQRPEPLGQHGTVVGAVESAYFFDTEVVLGPGESLFLYTDGVTEARGDAGFFGEEQLVEALSRPVGVHERVRDILGQVLGFQHQVPRDDIALLAVGVPPNPSP
ncbi:PP2C family protein-serine/threonine phosphatase [Nocardioides sp. SYSU D00065]|uniref:PP2C family protein-serine/threonine phosphatase n=1 Tax=Nocardioides sp. SYSU D00065 TaxID=2817378 RepID=UPI001B3245E2|nr:SpoIIE family protein phosphatase [Nocardioides sp. SYSU D00065]